jgi:hypothetical protein
MCDWHRLWHSGWSTCWHDVYEIARNNLHWSSDRSNTLRRWQHCRCRADAISSLCCKLHSLLTVMLQYCTVYWQLCCNIALFSDSYVAILHCLVTVVTKTFVITNAERAYWMKRTKLRYGLWQHSLTLRSVAAQPDVTVCGSAAWLYGLWQRSLTLRSVAAQPDVTVCGSTAWLYGLWQHSLTLL